MSCDSEYTKDEVILESRPAITKTLCYTIIIVQNQKSISDACNT